MGREGGQKTLLRSDWVKNRGGGLGKTKYKTGAGCRGQG